jgi:hypothetical protein
MSESLEEEIRLLRGAMKADDDRLRAAEIRAFGRDIVNGCDAAGFMADEIIALREELRSLRAAKPVAWGVRRSDGTWWETCYDTKEKMERLQDSYDPSNVVSPLYESPAPEITAGEQWAILQAVQKIHDSLPPAMAGTIEARGDLLAIAGTLMNIVERCVRT